MLFDLTDDQRLLYETTLRYLEAEASTPTIRTWADSELGYDAAWWANGAQLGWTQMLASEALGGGSVSGARVQDLGLIAHAFGRAVAPGPLVASNLCVLALDLTSNARLAAELAPVLVEGVEHGAVSNLGGHAGRDVRADPADGGLRLTGRTGPVEAGASATQLFIAVHSEGGTSLVVVPAEAPGITIRPLGGLDLSRRFADVEFDGVTVGVDRVVLTEHQTADLDLLRRTERVLRLCETVGCVDRVFEFTCEWAFDRHSFGRPLASYQELKHRFADMKTWLEACHATTDAAVRALDESDPEADLLVAVACSYVGDRAPEIIQDCVQMHGGIGVTADHDLHLYLRRVTQNRGLVGNPSDHLQAIARLIEEHA